jgi:hypothetical protein
MPARSCDNALQSISYQVTQYISNPRNQQHYLYLKARLLAVKSITKPLASRALILPSPTQPARFHPHERRVEHVTSKLMNRANMRAKDETCEPKMTQNVEQMFVCSSRRAEPFSCKQPPNLLPTALPKRGRQEPLSCKHEPNLLPTALHKRGKQEPLRVQRINPSSELPPSIVSNLPPRRFPNAASKSMSS